MLRWAPVFKPKLRSVRLLAATWAFLTCCTRVRSINVGLHWPFSLRQSHQQIWTRTRCWPNVRVHGTFVNLICEYRTFEMRTFELARSHDPNSQEWAHFVLNTTQSVQERRRMDNALGSIVAIRSCSSWMHLQSTVVSPFLTYLNFLVPEL